MATEPAFVTAKRKTGNATEYRGDVNVSLGDETVTFKHRLLNETEFTRLQQVLDTEAMSSDAAESDVDAEAIDGPASAGSGGTDGSQSRAVNPEMGETEAQERLLELQQKEALSDEEEAELQQLTEKVASETSKIKDALGQEGFDLLMKMGKEVIKPSQEDVDYIYNLTKEDPSQAMELMGLESLPQSMTKATVKSRLEDEYENMVTKQPYPIKLNVGMQAMAETISVLGNGLHE